MRVMKERFEEILTYELGVATDGEALNVSTDDRGVILKLSAKDFFEVGSGRG